MRLIISLLVLVGAAQFLLADGRDPTAYVSNGIYKYVNLNSVNSDVNISSNSRVILHSVVVNTVGSSSALEIYNARNSTATAATKIADIATTVAGTFTYDIYLDSGCAAFNIGSTPADVTVIYLDGR